MIELKANPKTHPSRVYVFSILFLALIAIGAFSIVHKYKKPGQMTIIESQAMDMSGSGVPVGSAPVSLETVEPAPFEASVTYAGSVVPYTEQEVTPRIEGWISDMNAYPGDRVKKGQLLARLTSPDVAQRSAGANYEATAASAFSGAAGDETAQAEKMVKAAEADLDSMKAELVYRDSELTRMKSLFENGAVSKSEYEQEKAMDASALAAVDKTQAELDASKHGLAAAQRKKGGMAAMASAAANRASAESTSSGYLVVKSLIDGVVTARLSGPGTLARAGQPILRIAQIDKVRLQANVSQSEAALITIGNSIEVTSDSMPGMVMAAKVTAVFPAADPVTRTVVVEALTDNSSGMYLPGQYVNMRITTGGAKTAITVPDRAIIKWGNGGKPAVWVAAAGKGKGGVVYTCTMHPQIREEHPGDCPICNMKLVPKKEGGPLQAHFVNVAVGRTSGERTEIIDGLNTGDKVIVDGGADLNEGDLVTATKWSADGPLGLPAPGGEGERAAPDNSQKNNNSMPGMKM
jgi:multidrug efflux pump subunit AcrA (membrane-fusion protein)